jgi:peptidoglycan/LPS O-acetylase OafA/YrhL
MICVSLTLQIVFPKVASLLNLDPSLITLLTSLSFTGAFFPGYFDNLVPTQWTIGVEMLFYVFVPILFLKIKSSRQALVGYVVTSSTSLLSIILIIALGGDDKLAWVNHLYPHIYKSILFQLPIFFLGILYFYFLKENKSYKTLLPVLWISLAQTIIFGLFQMLTLGKFDLSIISPRIQLTAVIFLFMIVGIQKTNILNGNKFLTFLGTISYSVYLLHYMILSCTAYTLTNMTWFRTLSAYSQFWILFILAYSIIILISSLTFKYIETPGQKIGSNLYKKLFP